MRIKTIFISILALCLSVAYAGAQNLDITGTVTDATDGSPMAGVMVYDPVGGGSSLTDLDGKYNIKAGKDAILEFTFLGMKTEKVAVAGRATIDIAMKTDVNLLEDVLVVAYGTTTKESFTGSAETVSSEKLKDRPVSNVTKMLDGQVAGVMTTSGSGQPGSGSDIRIRGFGSINASSSPLLVVDGVPYDGDLSSLNSSDIETMTVLKDASSGALYGARGANGVILITTKSIKDEENININLSAKVGINSRAIPFYSTTDAKQYMEHMYTATYHDLVYTEGYLPEVAAGMTADRLNRTLLGTDGIYNIYDKDINSLFDSNGKIVPGAKMKWNENWLKEAQAKCPVRQEYQFSINGSGKNSKYLASLSYLDEDGTLKTTGFRRYTARVGADFKPYEWLDFGLNMNYSNSRSDFLGASGTEGTNVWYSAMLMAPIYPVYQKNMDGSNVMKDGEKVFDYGSSRPAGAQNNRNSVGTLFDDDYYSLVENLGIRANLGVNWKGFSLTTNFGADSSNETQTTNFNIHNGNAAGTGRLTKENGRMFSFTWNQLLGYKKDFGEHNIDLMAGHEFYKYNYRYLIGERTGFPFEDYDELGMGATLVEGNSLSEDYAIDSYLFRANGSYADRYYVSASLRTDGSSRFKKENRWGVFWSVGASWRISQESFLKDVPWINNITLKASYGVQGNDNLGSYYAWQSLYNMTYPNANNSGAVLGSLENPDVTWEKNGNLNAGVEFRLFNRLYGTIEAFSRKTTDLLLEYPIPISLGLPGYYANIGSLMNNGCDITIGADILQTEDWYWNVSVMGSVLKNKVLALTGDGSEIITGNYLIREGEEINSFYMAKSAGVDPATGEQLYWAYKKDADGKMIAGSEYVTNDATVAASSKYLMGSRIPDLYGSVSSALKYKGFDLNLLFTYSIGGKVYDSVYSMLMEPSFIGQTYHVNALRGWTTPGQITDVPRVTTTTSTIACDRFLIDASYFAIKNIALGYTLPESLTSKAKIRSVRLFLAADSPWIFTHLKGMDPQASFSGSTSYTYTPNRTFTFGVDLKF